MKYCVDDSSTIFDWAMESNPLTEQIPHFLYHYRSGESARKMVISDGIRLRLTRADHFKDKLEGLAVKVYYEIALEELRKDSVITDGQFEMFIEFGVPEEDLFIRYDSDGWLLGQNNKSDVYVACFSTVKNDPYMFCNYGKGDERYCLEIGNTELEILSHKDFNRETKTELLRVLYGRQVIDYLKSFIIRIVQDHFLMKDSQNAKAIMEMKLYDLQFSAKRAIYSKENEIRLLVRVPKNMELSHDQYVTGMEDGCPYLWITLPKTALYEMYPSPSNSTAQIDLMREIAQSNQYDWIELLPHCYERPE